MGKFFNKNAFLITFAIHICYEQSSINWTLGKKS